MGAWIEIAVVTKRTIQQFVAPHMGAWIEIIEVLDYKLFRIRSHPTWVRGLKF